MVGGLPLLQTIEQFGELRLVLANEGPDPLRPFGIGRGGGSWLWRRCGAARGGRGLPIGSGDQEQRRRHDFPRGTHETHV
jgi:hypothetical protein